MIDGLQEILVSFVSWVFGLFLAVAEFMIKRLADVIFTAFNILPNPSDYVTYFTAMVDLIQPYVSYVVDMTFLDPIVIQLIVFSIILRVSSRILAYGIKLSLSWYKTIKP